MSEKEKENGNISRNSQVTDQSCGKDALATSRSAINPERRVSMLVPLRILLGTSYPCPSPWHVRSQMLLEIAGLGCEL